MVRGMMIVLKLKVFDTSLIIKKVSLHHPEERATEFLALEIFKTLQNDLVAQ